MAQLQSRISN